ncbi:hypothetical protein QOZ80_8AG0640500 [Eleusine coracana subsp. coracana]|nr:hypothetical protein QOZ80_8AG0640500 [Eleusine coracana subsp. coracana]
MEEDWVMLERFVFRRDKPLPENETTAASSTCIGIPFRVSLGLVAPPSTSRFYLEWPGGPDPDATVPCHLVAAHRGCVLFRLTFIVRTKTRPPDLIFPDDYYVYRPATGDLKRFPTCIPVAAADEEKEMLEQKQDDPISSDEGGGEFIMAELRLDRRNNRKKVSAEVSFLHSGTCEWVHMPGLPVHCNKNEYDSTTLHCFCSQSAVPFGGGLCWVDNRTGIIIGKAMLEQMTPNLSYISFPRMNPTRIGDDLRSVCATDGGNSLKFIDIVVNNQPRSTGFTILVYKLITAEDGCMKWDKETSMTSTEMWELEAPGRIPHEAVPMFPLMSLDEPHIVHFQLAECTDYIDTVTLVSIDMSAW